VEGVISRIKKKLETNGNSGKQVQQN